MSTTMSELVSAWLLLLLSHLSEATAPQGEPPVTLGKFSTESTIGHLRSYRGVTKHPLFDYTKDHSAYVNQFPDPDWYMQWYAQDYRTVDMAVMDLNLVPVYKTGNLGAGITIGIISDGVDNSHPELQRNYIEGLAYNFCKNRPGAQPDKKTQNYGTLAAGLIAMEANNKICGVGVAPEARITGIKGFCTKGKDFPVAESLYHGVEDIEIYTSVFGGKGSKPLSEEAYKAINNGLRNGRNGKGSIYVFPMGVTEPKSAVEHCSCAGSPYVNHPGVIGVTGVSQAGLSLSYNGVYGVNCAANFATVYAAENNGIYQGILSTTQDHTKCHSGHPGSWSASAFAAGIIALVLKANAKLTYRDVMHLIALSAEVAPLVDNTYYSWRKNKKGFWVSGRFGFGLMNAENMVNLAKNKWVNVPPEDRYFLDMKERIILPQTIGNNPLEVNIKLQKCLIAFVEQIVVTLTTNYPEVTDLSAFLVSPSGTIVKLLYVKNPDQFLNKLRTWTLKTIHFWGEDPRGDWTLKLYGYKMVVTKLTVDVYGTRTAPEYHQKLPRKYAGFRLKDSMQSSEPLIDFEMEEKLGKWPTKPSSTSLQLYEGVTKHPVYSIVESSAYNNFYNDPEFYTQWYMLDYRMEDSPVMDHNVVPVILEEYGGRRITIAVVGDGVFSDHPDINDNYEEALSVNACTGAGGATPRSDRDVIGTASAGLIAMEANNKKCGVGIAPYAKVAGIVVVCSGKNPLEYDIHFALSYKLKHFDIYDNAWSGEAMQPLSNIISSALENGILLGRNGIGAIYIFPAGVNDGSRSCACYGHLNHYGVIVVNGASQAGKKLSYGQRCTAILATAYAADKTYEPIMSISSKKEYRRAPSGTYTAAAFASGIIALLLQARPSLTYRDVMHVITMSAEVAPLADNPGTWSKNGAGFWVSSDFGFGLLNAENMVDLVSKNWENVPQLHICKESIVIKDPKMDLDQLNAFKSAFLACKGTENEVVFMEQIEITLTFKYSLGGAFKIVMISPQGTSVVLWEPIPTKMAPTGLENITIKSVLTWGENPAGTWLFQFRPTFSPALVYLDVDTPTTGHLESLTMTVYGTQSQPAHYARLPRSYTGFRLQDGTTSEVTKPNNQ